MFYVLCAMECALLVARFAYAICCYTYMERCAFRVLHVLCVSGTLCSESDVSYVFVRWVCY